MAGPQITGIAAQGPLPAGMLRIRQGSQERYVWPVHLPGWLALGWRVAGAEAASVGITAASGELLEQDDATPAATRSRRGRRRKDEQEQAPASIETTPEPTGTVAEVGVADAAADAFTADGELSVIALPDDLFDEPLI
ncbi:hypothetical protein NZK27_02410 [Synechococcus sp. FGCU-3]|nr:hypothetical protein [Synechococcus sp. FGCU3]